MKKPSRYMPKYEGKQISVLSWLFLAFLLGLLIWLIWLFPHLLLLILIFIFIQVRDERKRIKHFEILLKKRQKDSICTFARHFKYQEVDTWVIRAVYEQLQSYINLEKTNFPIRPSDDVFTDLKIDDEDFVYNIVEEIAERTGRSLEKAESNPYYKRANIVENLVYFFNEQPKINAI